MGGDWVAMPFFRDRPGDTASVGGIVFCWTVAACWFVLAGAALCRSLALRGLGAFVDEQGVGALVNGEQTWRLDWEHFGGAELVRQKLWDAILHPREGGIRIFNRQGVAVHSLPVDSGPNLRSEQHPRLARRFFIQALNAHTPPSGPTIDTDRKPVRRMTAPWAWVAVTVGASLLGTSVWMFCQMLQVVREPVAGSFYSSVPGGILTLGAAVMGVVAAFSGSVDLYARRHPRYDRAPVPRPNPEEGPHIDEHRLEHGIGKRIELEEGVRYRVVHPEVVVGQMRLCIYGLRLASRLGFGSALACQLIGIIARDPEAILPFAALTLIFASIGYLSALSLPVYRARLDSLGDTIVKHDEQLIIVKPGGTSLGFGPRARWRKLLLSSPIEEVSEHGVRYYIDRSHLYASDTPLDIEEQAKLSGPA